MKILSFIAENFKKIRIVEINPKGRMVQVTGKNGQGKTSVLDAIWAALEGAKAIPMKPVRKGAERARIKLDLGEFIATRTILPNGKHELKLENAKGVPVTSPQKVLDELLGALTFDPLEFVTMDSKKQIETLRSVAKIELDIDALNAATQKDYEERRNVKRDADRLRTEMQAVIVQDGLPKEKVDEKAILSDLRDAGIANAKAQEQFLAKQRLWNKVQAEATLLKDNERYIENGLQKIAKLEKELAAERESVANFEGDREQLANRFNDLTEEHSKAPDGTVIDVAELTAELQRAQLVNREIDKQARRQDLEFKLREKEHQADVFTRAMEAREEQKRNAMQAAAMPVAGLAFDEDQVTLNGIPLDQLGEAEQIRVSTAIAMAANPELRILRILHGEALDDDSLKIIADMAEEHDFQIWIAKVDSSGKVGIVMEDGMIKAEAAE